MKLRKVCEQNANNLNDVSSRNYHLTETVTVKCTPVKYSQTDSVKQSLITQSS